MDTVPDTLTIGEFSRITHLSVKTLRHYHQVGLLEPVDVDTRTGYRHYTTGQIPTAQVIRRFRSLDMPVEEVKAVLSASDHEARNALISGPPDAAGRRTGPDTTLGGVTAEPPREPPQPPSPWSIGRCQPLLSAGIHDTVNLEDLLPWFQRRPRRDVREYRGPGPASIGSQRWAVLVRNI